MPAFPDIKKILLKHQHIILEDDELKTVFPNGAKDFQVSERREAKNLKELLAKSKIATLEVEDQSGGSQPCNKNCAYCEMLRKTASHEFKSLRTGCRYKMRQNITCESKDIVYLVTCNKHNIQGVGCTTDLKSRISNYMNHHQKKNASCSITEHFLQEVYWQENLITYEPYGMNKAIELERMRVKIRNRKKSKQH